MSNLVVKLNYTSVNFLQSGWSSDAAKHDAQRLQVYIVPELIALLCRPSTKVVKTHNRTRTTSPGHNLNVVLH